MTLNSHAFGNTLIAGAGPAAFAAAVQAAKEDTQINWA